jgi:ketosteroid isomerase-like protein
MMVTAKAPRSHFPSKGTAVSTSQLPAPIAALLRAANARDTAALLKTLADEAVITDLGQRLQGEDLRRWSDALFVKSNMAVRPIGITEREGNTVVSVVVHGVKPGTRTHLRRDWQFTIDGTRIAALDMAPGKEPDLPSPVATFVRSTNARDLEGLMAAFAEDAMVNDDLQERWGKAAIREWAEQEFIGQGVNIFVVKCVERTFMAVLTAHVDGDFDQRGMPYPLVLSFYFSMDGENIVQLLILRNQPD